MSETKEYYVYKHTNKTNGKVYIGITSQKQNRRWQNGKGYKDNFHFNRAINKYGWDGFDHLVLVRGLTKDEAKWLEIQLIAAYDSTNREKGYNISKGGDIVSDESRQKISKTLKGKYVGENNPWYGKHHTEEARKKMSESHKGKSLSEETKRKLSKIHSRTVICLTTKQIFYGTKEAETTTGAHKTHIGAACNGKRKSAGKLPDGTPLKWAYVKDLPKPQLTDEQKQNLKNGPKILKLA